MVPASDLNNTAIPYFYLAAILRPMPLVFPRKPPKLTTAVLRIFGAFLIHDNKKPVFLRTKNKSHLKIAQMYTTQEE
jgi:hypothetical protein